MSQNDQPSAHRQTRSPGRPRKQGEDGGQTQAHILQAASELFMQHGFEKVSLSQIAGQCQVTKATVYYYFSNKADLFAAAFSQVFQKVKAYTLHLLEQDKPLKERLADIALGHFAHARADFGTVMNNARPYLTEQHLSQIRDAEEAVHRLIAEYFEAAMQAGEWPRRDPYFMAQVYTSMLMAGHHAPVAERFASPQMLAADLVHLFWHGAAGEHSGKQQAD